MKNILSILLIIFVTINLKAQDPEFTQFYANPIYLNPAFAGTANGPRFAVNYRNQWPSISGNFISYSASYDQHFDALAGGIGFQVLYDRAGDGDLTTTGFSSMYSYHLNVSPKFTIKAALQASVQQKSIDFSKLLFGDMIDPSKGFIYKTKEAIPINGQGEIRPFIDFSAGIIGFTNKFYAGAAVHHINEPNMSFFTDEKSILPMKLTAHVGMLMPMDNSRHPKNFFSPNILFQKQGNFMQFNIGGYYIKEYFLAGLWLRQTSVNTDAFMILLGIKKDPVKFGYSYDITFSDARIGAKGSHEISFIIQLKAYKRPPSTKWRKLICPSF